MGSHVYERKKSAVRETTETARITFAEIASNSFAETRQNKWKEFFRFYCSFRFFLAQTALSCVYFLEYALFFLCFFIQAKSDSSLRADEMDS